MKTIPKLSPELSNFLNFVRWIAALLVVITHIRTLFFEKLENIETPTLAIKVFYFITSLGGEAVMVFFVLSGFLVGGKVLIQFKENTFSWKDYLIKRITRLYIVLIPALIAGGLLDYIGIHFFNTTGVYNNILHLTPFNYNIENRLNLTTFISNIFMLQTTLTPTFGSNGPLWSLANEFWYYIMFPLLLSIIYNQSILHKFIKLILFSLICYFLNLDIILYFPIWIVGVIAYQFIEIRVSLFMSLILFAIGVFLEVSHFFPYQKLGALTLSISVAILILSINNHKFQILKKTNHLFADFSYTLYLFHDPFLLIIFASCSLSTSLIPNISNILLFCVFLICINVYAYSMYYIFERNTHIVRNYFFRIFY